MSKRSITQIVKGTATSDGAGVKLTRIMGLHELPDLDPFLLLDTFESDNPDDYIGGFPPHPHRGFETVTYLLHGRMRHKDSAGNEGVIKPGGVQWMTAGKGIVHSEMPEQENGLLQGLQLWVNLPAKDKMVQPSYQEYDASEIPIETREGDTKVHVIAGNTSRGTNGPVTNKTVNPIYYNIELGKQGEFIEKLESQHNAFIYVLQGNIAIKSDQAETKLAANHLAVLSKGDKLHISNQTEYSRIILIAGKPLNEPIARSGPFVMNTQQEIKQAIVDYQEDNFI